MSENVDWECQNCGEYYRASRNADELLNELPMFCSWCNRETTYEIAEHDQ